MPDQLTDIEDTTPLLSVVIPAYDEEGRIEQSLERASAFLRGQPYAFEILVVDDGSRDRTADLVRAFHEREPRVRLLTIEHGGKGKAVQAGMLSAIGRLRYLADADFSTPIEEVSCFLEEMERGADLVIGSREVQGAKRIGEPTRRHVMGRVFNRLIQLVLLPGIEDTQCGFKCLRANAAEDLFTRLSSMGFAFDVELLTHARYLGYRTREVPVTWTYVSGSKVRVVRDTLAMFRDVFRIRRMAWRLYGFDAGGFSSNIRIARILRAVIGWPLIAVGLVITPTPIPIGIFIVILGVAIVGMRDWGLRYVRWRWKRRIRGMAISERTWVRYLGVRLVSIHTALGTKINAIRERRRERKANKLRRRIAKLEPTEARAHERVFD